MSLGVWRKRHPSAGGGGMGGVGKKGPFNLFGFVLSYSSLDGLSLQGWQREKGKK